MTQWPVRDMNNTLKFEVEKNLNKSSSLTLLFTGVKSLGRDLWKAWEVCRYGQRPAITNSGSLLFPERHFFRVLIYTTQFPYR